MKIFISHASRNREIVLKFAGFLEMVNSNIDVFCSSESGSIKVGQDFIETIYEELSSSDLFVPIISKEYYESKFCMMELGVAYSYLYERYQKRGDEYIFPFALYPIKKNQALSGTPIANIQTGDINDEEDVRCFLDYLKNDKGIDIGAGINRKLHSLKYDIDKIFLKDQNFLGISRLGIYFDNNIYYKSKKDIADFSRSADELIVNFNMHPYEIKEFKYPDFISMVLKFVDGLDLGRYLDFNDAAEFSFMLNNYTNSLKRIFVEFKYSLGNKILETFEFQINNKENRCSILLEKMKSNALCNISEICFVIHPDDIVEDEGMFKIGEIKVQ